VTNKWSTKDFKDCIDRVKNTSKILKRRFLEDGDYPIISQERDLINGYWSNRKDVFSVERPVVIFGDHTKVLKYIDFDFVIGADGVKILQVKPFLHPKYFYYYLNAFSVKTLGYARHHCCPK
jgi:type I restriction enzyme S subunit